MIDKTLITGVLILLIGIQAAYAKKDAAAANAKKDTVAVSAKKNADKADKNTDKSADKNADKGTDKIADKIVEEGTRIKVEGVLEVGFDNNYKMNKSGENEYKKIGEAKVDISARPIKKVRAEMGFEYNNKDSMFTIDKLYGQYNFATSNSIRFGYMKKSFGPEERTDINERYFHKRSITNDSLEYYGFLDHDLTLQYRYDFNLEWQFRGGFSWKDSTHYLQNYSIEYDDKKTSLILAAIIRHYLPEGEDAITSFISSLSVKRATGLFASEAELTCGSNPAIKARYDRNAFIFGARLKENFFINTDTKILSQIIPVAEAAFFSGDFLEDNNYATQFRTGITLGFTKNSSFQWRNNFGAVSRKKEFEKKEHWRRRFDSEVVVIF